MIVVYYTYIQLESLILTRSLMNCYISLYRLDYIFTSN
nr:MAG TPA: hypothetical protein [Caudoviricetes sp.]